MHTRHHNCNLKCTSSLKLLKGDPNLKENKTLIEEDGFQSVAK